MRKKSLVGESESLFPEEKSVKREGPAKKRVLFSVKAAAGAKVYVAGTFNDWNPEATPLKDAKGTGEFSCGKLLAPGRYEYKFIINGIWDVDVNNPAFVPNCMGSMNSVLEVK